MNSKVFFVLCLVAFIAIISANEGKGSSAGSKPHGLDMPQDTMSADSDVAHERVRRQWGYGGYGMGGYGMGGYGMGYPGMMYRRRMMGGYGMGYPMMGMMSMFGR